MRRPVPRGLKRGGFLAFLAGAPVPASAQWAQPPVIRRDIVADLPHDTAAFTQGLVWVEGHLYESVGLYGKSELREVNARNGAVLRARPLPPDVFAEGLAHFRGELVQLTWKEGVAFRYPLKRWDRPGRFAYGGEGWGLTSLGQSLCMSNGSDTLYHRNAAFKITRKVPVRLAGKPLSRLNELEAVGGKVVANVWYSDSLFIIDPRDGKVVAIVDGTALAARSRRRSKDQVLNGIAYDSRKKVFLLTGKNWPVLFKVRIPFAF
jgi:glutamine cyclotransferase